MKILNVNPDDYVNYNDGSGDPSLFVGIGTCRWKCCKEAGVDISVCQNSELAKSQRISMSAKDFCDKYMTDSIGSVVVGGLEPFDDCRSLFEFMGEFSKRLTGFDFVIYTGYREDEIGESIWSLLRENIGQNRLIIKFGRFVPGQTPHKDEVLGVELSSDNQYGKIVIDRRPEISR